MVKFLSRIGLSPFLLCLVGAIILARFFPSFGTAESPLHLPEVAEYGVVVIFLFYGLKLTPQKLKAGLVNWKLHVMIQATTFIIFPAFIMLLQHFFNTGNNTLLRMGAFYLAALPSTVSSSVVMVAIAGGNMPAAIFNASISSILGILITPLWMSTVLEKSNTDFNTTHVILRLCLEVLLPVILGLLLNKKLGHFAERYKTSLKNFDQFIILLIVYTSFAESFAGRMFDNLSIGEISMLGLAMAALFLFIFGMMYLIAGSLKFSREDRITLLFCGSKKSLVQGAVMGRVLFPDPLVLGVVLLPLMLYHALQLMMGSAIAQSMGKKMETVKQASTNVIMK